MGAEDQFSANPDMPYDLRQTYAIRILEPILLQIEELRNRDDFVQLYKVLTYSLYTNLYQKLTEDEIKEYKELKEKVISEINKYSSTFNGKDKDPDKLWKVRDILQEFELWFKKKMQEHGLYGSGWSDDEGL